MDRRTFITRATTVAAVTPFIGLSMGPLMGCSTGWIDTAISDIPTIVSIADSILGVVGLAVGNGTLASATGVIISGAATAVNAGLVTLKALIQDYQTAPNATVLQKIDAALTDVRQNLQAILMAGGIKNAALQVTISTAVTLALSALSAIQLLIPVGSVASATTLKASGNYRHTKQELVTKTHLPSSDNVKTMYNAVAVTQGYGAFQIK